MLSTPAAARPKKLARGKPTTPAAAEREEPGSPSSDPGSDSDSGPDSGSGSGSDSESNSGSDFGSDAGSGAASGSASEREETGGKAEDEDYQAAALAKLQALMAASFGGSDSASGGPSQSNPDPELEERDDDARSDYGFSDGSHASESDSELESHGEEDEMSRTLAALDRPLKPKAMKRKASPPVRGKAKKPKQAEVIVFDGDVPGAGPTMSAAERKRFMAAQTSKIMAQEEENTAKKPTTEEDSEEKANKTNDRLLSELLSNTLFAPGSEAGGVHALSSAYVGKKRKNKPDLAGNGTLARILELSAPAHVRARQGLGRGAGIEALRAQELGKRGQKERREASRGLKRRQAEEKARQAELGIHTKTFVTKDKKERTRDKGIGMGIGKFKGGALHLSQKDIERVQGKKKR